MHGFSKYRVIKVIDAATGATRHDGASRILETKHEIIIVDLYEKQL